MKKGTWRFCFFLFLYNSIRELDFNKFIFKCDTKTRIERYFGPTRIARSVIAFFWLELQHDFSALALTCSLLFWDCCLYRHLTKITVYFVSDRSRLLHPAQLQTDTCAGFKTGCAGRINGERDYTVRVSLF